MSLAAFKDLGELAARQHGLLTREQALTRLSRWQLDYRVQCGAMQAVRPCVFKLAGAPTTWLQQLKAIGLWLREGYAFSHCTAAALHGFGRFREGPLELTATRVVSAPPSVLVHHADVLPPRDLASVKGLRVTSVARTLLDLAAVVASADLKATVDEALRRRWATVEQLDTAVQRARGRRGVLALRGLVDEFLGGRGPTESELEALVEELLEAAGLPRPILQERVIIGGRLRRLDFRIPGTDVVIEAEGYAYHSGLAAFEKDRARHNALQARGYRVLQWTWTAIRERPTELIHQLVRLLAP